MSCGNCGSNLVIKTSQKYHYLMSGLNNVYLENIKIEICESCNETNPYIYKIVLLHKLIACNLVFKSGTLTGKEIRFLRKERGKRIKDWALFLGIEEKDLLDLENETKEATRTLDNLIRLVYCQIFEEEEKEKIIENISNILLDSKRVPVKTININSNELSKDNNINNRLSLLEHNKAVSDGLDMAFKISNTFFVLYDGEYIEEWYFDMNQKILDISTIFKTNTSMEYIYNDDYIYKEQ